MALSMLRACLAALVCTCCAARAAVACDAAVPERDLEAPVLLQAAMELRAHGNEAWTNGSRVGLAVAQDLYNHSRMLGLQSALELGAHGNEGAWEGWANSLNAGAALTQEKHPDSQLLFVVLNTLCFLLVLALILAWDAVKPGHLLDVKLTPQADLKEETWSPYRRFFLQHKNVDFGKNAERACRGGIVFGFYALPFFLPRGMIPIMDDLIARDMYSAFIGQQLLFNYQATAGESIRSAAQLTAGTLMAFTTIWILLGFYPHGVGPEASGHPYVVGICFGTSVILSMIWLNLPMKVTIFFLVRFSEWWMAFLNPNVDVAAAYSVGFHFKLSGTAMKAILATLVGSMLALIANLLPYPVLAINVAEEECYTSMGLLKSTWRVFDGFMKQPSKRQDMMSNMQRELFRIKHVLDTCDSHIALSWWECFGMGPRQKVRVKLAALNHSNQEMYLRILGAVQCCLADDTFACHHLELMGRLEAASQLIERAGENMYSAAMCVRRPDIKSLESGIQTTREAITSITRDFLKTKAELGLADIDDTYVEEHVFVRSVCQFGRMSCEIAESVVADHMGLRPLTKHEHVAAIFDFKIILSKDHMIFASRTSLTFAMVFVVGYFGFSDIINPYTFSVPSTMAMLIAPGYGLQHKKNFLRLQGVVLGTSMGVMMNKMFSTCSALACLGSTFMTVGWISLTLLGHFHCTEMSYLCFLLALFGQNQLVRPCGEASQASFQLVFNVVAAILVMTFTDSLMPTQPSSHQAANAIETAWVKVQEAYALVLDPKVGRRQHKEELKSLISKADALGIEAASEFRLWRTPWREQSYDKGIATLRLIRGSLHTIEECISCGSSVHADDALFKRVMYSQSMQAIVKLMRGKMENEHDLMNIFSHEQTVAIPQLDAATRRFIEHDMEDFIKNLTAEARGVDLKPDCSKSLEYDCACRVSCIVACISSIVSAMSSYQSAMIYYG